MNNTGKTITAITTAAAIGTGVLLTTTQEPALVEQEQPVEQVEFVDDIKPIEVPIFSVDIPVLNPVTVEIFGVEIPNIEDLSPETIQVATAIIESIGVEKFTQEQIKVLVTIVDVVKVNGYSVETIQIATNVIGDIGVENFNPVQIKIIVETINKLDDDVPKIQALKKMLNSIIKDKRMLQYDRTLSIYNEALTAWLEIYNRQLPPEIKYIPLRRGIRMIAELRSSKYARNNLIFYKKQGYNACLITINGTETIEYITELIKIVKGLNMQPWIAWAGPEKLEWSIYQDPAKTSKLLREAAANSVGYIAAWRRTSAHLVAQDAQYIEYLVSEVRKANPTIMIVGESYYGQTFENLPHVNQKGWEARDNVVRRQSGILIAGIATQGYAIESLLNNIFGKWKKTGKLGMVLGESPYYASTNNNNKSFTENLKIKRQLELRFVSAGCIGTITIHGDGSDRGSTLMTVDDLGKYRID